MDDGDNVTLDSLPVLVGGLIAEGAMTGSIYGAGNAKLLFLVTSIGKQTKK